MIGVVLCVATFVFGFLVVKTEKRKKAGRPVPLSYALTGLASVVVILYALAVLFFRLIG